MGGFFFALWSQLAGGGGVYTVEFLYHKFHAKILRNLFVVFKGLPRYTLGCACAHLYHARGFG